MATIDQTRAPVPITGAGALVAGLRAPVGAQEDRLIRTVAALVLAGAALAYALRNHALAAQGGAPWLHGEWLTSFAAGPLRRGLSGEFIFALSDLTGLGPIAVVSLVQIAAVWTLTAAVLVFLWRMKGHTSLAVLAMTPAFVPFWQNALGAHAKDVFTLCAFVPLLMAAVRLMEARRALLLSAGVFFLSAAFYEPAVLFAPALVLTAWFATRLDVDAPAFRRFILFVGLSSALWFGFAIAFSSVANSQPLCDAILQRGVSAAMCQKFVWVTANLDQAISYVGSRSNERIWGGFALAAGLSLLPVGLLAWGRPPALRVLVPALAQTIVFLPLYIVATDYGRWLNLQLTATVLILFAATATGHLPILLKPKPRAVIYPLVLLALSWNLSPVMGAATPGLAAPLIRAIAPHD